MECKHKSNLNDANFCLVECYYCTIHQKAECKERHPEYFEKSMKSAEEIRKQIIESFWNKPVLGKHYVDWHTEDGESGLTLMFNDTNEKFDIIIRKK